MWISVKDRLPENNGRVIILTLDSINDYCYPYCYEDAVEVGFYEKGRWYSETRFEILDSQKIEIRKKLFSTEALEKNLKNDEAPGWGDIPVTHWMPLPEQPKK